MYMMKEINFPFFDNSSRKNDYEVESLFSTQTISSVYQEYFRPSRFK